VPIRCLTILLPEEMPIVIGFFYSSSITRYKPDFPARLRDSMYWPVFVALRKHALYKFLLLFTSFVRQETFIVKPQEE
jgi:hypothetical protein